MHKTPRGGIRGARAGRCLTGGALQRKQTALHAWPVIQRRLLHLSEVRPRVSAAHQACGTVTTLGVVVVWSVRTCSHAPPGSPDMRRSARGAADGLHADSARAMAALVSRKQDDDTMRMTPQRNAHVLAQRRLAAARTKVWSAPRRPQQHPAAVCRAHGFCAEAQRMRMALTTPRHARRSFLLKCSVHGRGRGRSRRR